MTLQDSTKQNNLLYMLLYYDPPQKDDVRRQDGQDDRIGWEKRGLVLRRKRYYFTKGLIMD